MPPKPILSLSCALSLLILLGSLALLRASGSPVYSGVTAHEWGTFTSIAGPDGRAVEWSPLTGSTDLPPFVEHLATTGYKRGLRGTVRMETPVLYFYSYAPETLSVQVSFSKGLITEWYPHASRVEPSAPFSDASLYLAQPDGRISWDSITLTPSLADFPQGTPSDRYFAARAATSTPLRVPSPAGEQHEKFLFYRGVSSFAVPLSATISAQSQVRVESLSKLVIPSVILFERRGVNVGYRIASFPTAVASLDAPELNSSVESLARDLEDILISQGLYQNEAQAMLQTWRDFWFEEGSRLFYILPPEFVNSVLPLIINPAPIQTTRVFVGRLELVTPATQAAVERALAAHDRATLAKYGRFLEPILATMFAGAPTPEKARQLSNDLDLYYNSLSR